MTELGKEHLLILNILEEVLLMQAHSNHHIQVSCSKHLSEIH